jgi:hypothetical protein
MIDQLIVFRESQGIKGSWPARGEMVLGGAIERLRPTDIVPPFPSVDTSDAIRDSWLEQAVTELQNRTWSSA